MPVKESDRPYLEDLRMLSRDRDGREILVGLSYDETEWYFAYLENEYSVNHPPKRKGVGEDRADRDRYIELHNRHEKMRFAIVMGEIEAVRTPIKH